jgi:hypothetical protein
MAVLPLPLRNEICVNQLILLNNSIDLKSAAYLNKGRAGSIPAPGTNTPKRCFSLEKQRFFILNAEKILKLPFSLVALIALALKIRVDCQKPPS